MRTRDFLLHLIILFSVPWSFGTSGIAAAFLNFFFVTRVRGDEIWYGSRGPDGVRLWTTTSARMPEGPRTRMLLFSSSAFKLTRRASEQRLGARRRAISQCVSPFSCRKWRDCRKDQRFLCVPDSLSFYRKKICGNGRI